MAVRDAEEYGPKRATVLKRVHDTVEARGSVGDRTCTFKMSYPG